MEFPEERADALSRAGLCCCAHHARRHPGDGVGHDLPRTFRLAGRDLRRDHHPGKYDGNLPRRPEYRACLRQPAAPMSWLLPR